MVTFQRFETSFHLLLTLLAVQIVNTLYHLAWLWLLHLSTPEMKQRKHNVIK
jgi:hypothetical protein